jgi:hypothetical protein
VAGGSEDVQTIDWVGDMRRFAFVLAGLLGAALFAASADPARAITSTGISVGFTDPFESYTYNFTGPETLYYYVSSDSYFFTYSVTDHTTPADSYSSETALGAAGAINGFNSGSSYTVTFELEDPPCLSSCFGETDLTTGLDPLPLLAPEFLATPLPAALPLMGSVLGAGYLVSMWRRRRPRNQPAVAAA